MSTGRPSGHDIIHNSQRSFNYHTLTLFIFIKKCIFGGRLLTCVRVTVELAQLQQLEAEAPRRDASQVGDLVWAASCDLYPAHPLADQQAARAEGGVHRGDVAVTYSPHERVSEGRLSVPFQRKVELRVKPARPGV
jgi:hypothetical protein